MTYFCRMNSQNKPNMKTSRIDQEKQTVEQMIRLYCHHKEGNPSLCEECASLLRYAHHRLDHCRFGEAKPTCRQCPVHCYKPDLRLRMQAVMRYAGPRMLLYHPLAALRHLWKER